MDQRHPTHESPHTPVLSAHTRAVHTHTSVLSTHPCCQQTPVLTTHPCCPHTHTRAVRTPEERWGAESGTTCSAPRAARHAPGRAPSEARGRAGPVRSHGLYHAPEPGRRGAVEPGEKRGEREKDGGRGVGAAPPSTALLREGNGLNPPFSFFPPERKAERVGRVLLRKDPVRWSSLLVTRVSFVLRPS